jgi:ribosomal protein S18 acetylase RimI-like enzyme
MQVTIERALSVLPQIPEFDPAELPSGYDSFAAAAKDFLSGEHLILAESDRRGQICGMLIAYDKYGDGSLYCWLAGVLPAARRQGALTAMMEEMEQWALARGYTSIRLSTRNRFRGMLAYLVKAGYLFITVKLTPDARDASVHVRKELT